MQKVSNFLLHSSNKLEQKIEIMQKQCTSCGEFKLLSEYNKCSASKDLLTYFCKKCDKDRHTARKRTKLGLLSEIYSRQKRASKKRHHYPPEYTKDELIYWCINQQIFHELYDNWVLSEYDKWMIPSCDRTDDSMGYSLNRLQLMTWRQNAEKSFKDTRSGKLMSGSKPQKKIIGKCRKLYMEL